MANARISRRRALGAAAALGAGAIASFLPRGAKTDGLTRPYKAFLPAVAADSATPANYPAGSFRLLADKLGFKMGVLVARNDFDKMTASGLTQALVGDQYNGLTVEGLNLRTIAPTRDTTGIHYAFSRADAVVKYGQDNQMEEFGESLSWWRTEQIPPWVNDIRSKDEADAVLVETTTAIVSHFAGIRKWAISEYGQRFHRVDVMEQKWGSGYLFRVAEIAKRIDPSLRMYYVDWGDEVQQAYADRDFLLMQRGVADGLFDGMYFEGDVLSYPSPTYDAYVRILERFRNLNNGRFQVGISEFGVDQDRLPPGTPKQNAQMVADITALALKAVLAVGGDYFAVNAAWDGNINKLVPNESMLFDAVGNPYPVRDRLVSVLAEEAARRGLR
jgi:GH35 family endo-1,4-beta-xylanase